MNRERLLDEIKEHEGFVEHVYKDSLGYDTIGYGFLVDKGKGGEIPLPVAEYWLNFKVNQIMERLRRELPWFAAAPDHVQRALVNMSYQMGVSGVLKFRNMLAHLEAGQWVEAGDEALDSRWARQTPNRAAKVVQIMKGYGDVELD